MLDRAPIIAAKMDSGLRGNDGVGAFDCRQASDMDLSA
jgi:hypothetical protein